MQSEEVLASGYFLRAGRVLMLGSRLQVNPARCKYVVARSPALVPGQHNQRTVLVLRSSTVLFLRNWLVGNAQSACVGGSLPDKFLASRKWFASGNALLSVTFGVIQEKGRPATRGKVIPPGLSPITSHFTGCFARGDITDLSNIYRCRLFFVKGWHR